MKSAIKVTTTRPTAVFIRDVGQGSRGHQKLYRMQPPMKDEPWDENEEPRRYEYVVASAVVVPYGSGPETYLFGADESGEIVRWAELPGSYKGGLSHDKALSNAGYHPLYVTGETE